MDSIETVEIDLPKTGLYRRTCCLNGLRETPKLQEMECAKELPKSQRTQWKQWAACISATLSMVAAGTVYGWSTTKGPVLSDDNITDVRIKPINITSDEGSWVVSLTVIGSMIGPFYGAFVAASYGRKLCLLITSVFYILGWLLVIFAQNAWYLYFSRIILGIGVGMSYTANPMYVSEVADVNIRGALSTLIAVNVFTGSLIACSVGPYTSYLTLGLVLLAIPILFVATFLMFPETPYYLVSKNKTAEAERSIAFFKGLTNIEEIRQELDIVRKNIGESSEGDFEELKFSLSDFRDLLMKVRNRRALLIVMGLILGQQLSGNFSTIQYMEQMFTKGKLGMDVHIATIIVVAVGLVSGAVSTVTVDNAGRRPLLNISSFFCAMSLGALGIHLKFNEMGWKAQAPYNLLPVIYVIIFQIVYQIGLGTMPNLLIGELFPTNVKGIAGAIITVFDGLMGFVVSKMFGFIFNNLGGYVPYLFFAISCFVLFIFVYGFVPETKGKTFNEIQDILGEMRPFNMPTSNTKCCAFRRRRTNSKGEVSNGNVGCWPLKRTASEVNKYEEA